MTGYIIQPDRSIAVVAIGLDGGSNGKTSFTATITKLVGEHNVASQSIGEFEKNRFAVASLFGKMMLLDDDVNANTRLPDGFLKKVSEGKILTGEYKHKDPFSFTSRAMPFLLCNSPPSLTDLSYGTLPISLSEKF